MPRKSVRLGDVSDSLIYHVMLLEDRIYHNRPKFANNLFYYKAISVAVFGPHQS